MESSDEKVDRFRRFLRESTGADPDAETVSLGRLAIDMKFATPEQVLECIREQQRMDHGGKRDQLGQILVKRGHLKPAQLVQILARQEDAIVVCIACGRVQQGGKTVCESCGENIQVTEVAAEGRPRDGEQVGRFRIRRLLGRGGMGAVYEAEDPKMERTIALKVLWEGKTDPQVVRRLHREAALAGGLRHPNIVAVHEVGEAKNNAGQTAHFIAMDLVDGQTWAALQSEKSKTTEDHLRILLDVSRAVGYAHEKGVVHRDIKPENVLVDVRGRARLTDFGLAWADSKNTRLTKLDSRIGTPLYMAPEQVRGRTVDARTDVYGLGVLLYEILTGAPPFTGETPAQVYDRILTDEPVAPRRIREGIHADLEAISLYALEKDMAQRYADAGAFADDLARHLRHEPILGPGASGFRRLLAGIFRRKALILAAVAGFAFAAGLFLLFGNREEEPPPRPPPENNEAREEARPHLEEGRALLQRLDVLLADSTATAREAEALAEKARVQFMKASALDPKSAEPHLGLARSYEMRNQLKDAVAACDAAIEAEPDHVGAYLERALMRIMEYRPMRFDLGARHLPESRESARVRRAIEEDLNRVRRSSRDPRDLQYAEALLLFTDGKFAEASERLRTYAENQVTDGPAWFWAAMAMYKLRKPKECLELLTQSLRYRPGEVRTIMMRASMRKATGDLRGALEDNTEAIRLRPRTANAWNNRGIVYHLLGELELSLRDYNQALQLSPGTVQFLVNRGRTYRDLGEDDAALEDYTKAIELAPDTVMAWNNRGSIHLSRGDGEKAVRDFSEAVKRDPKFTMALVNRGIAHRVSGNPDQALKDFDEAIRLKPGDAESYYQRARCHLALNKPAQAVEDLETALRRSPGKSLRSEVEALLRRITDP